MKNALRLVSLLLVLVMTLGVLVACGKKDKTEKPQTPGGEKEHWTNGLNFDGTDIKFLVCNGDEATKELPARSIWVDPEGDNSFVVNAAVVDRNTEVESTLGVKIGMDFCEQGQTSSTIMDSLTTGLHAYDVVGAYQYYDLGLTIGEQGGMFVNYEDEANEDEMYLNVDQPWWDKDLYDTLTYGGCAFWVSGDLSQTWIASVFVSFVNNKLWKEKAADIAALPAAKGISDPFELVNQGLWSIDLWSEISKAIYSDDNDNDKIDIGDTVGFLTYEPGLVNIMADGLAAGANIKYSARENDTWVMTFKDTRTNLFATKIGNLYSSSKACLMSWDDGKYIMSHFAEAKALMTVNQLHMSELYLADMPEFLVLPVPTLIAGEKHTTMNHDNVTLFGIPYTTKSEEKLAATTATLELMGELSYELVTPAYYENALKTRYSHAEDMDAQAEMMDKIRASVVHDFAAIYANLIGTSGGSVTHFFRTECAKGAGLVSSIESKNNAWTTGLEEVLIDIEEAYFMGQ